MFLYASEKNEHPTIAARTIEDIRLDEDLYAADFELGKRYQDASREIVRLSLLGIAGYGFLIKEVVTSNNVHDLATPWIATAAVLGLVLLALAAGFGLYYGDLTTTCLRMQINILRLLQRRTAKPLTHIEAPIEHLPAKWHEQNEADLERWRERQRFNLTRSRHTIRLAIWLLIFGIGATAVEFMLVIYSVPQHSKG